jgi:hypothetical protein
MDHLAIRLAKLPLANERAAPACLVWLKSLEGRLNVGSHLLMKPATTIAAAMFPPVAGISRLA